MDGRYSTGSFLNESTSEEHPHDVRHDNDCDDGAVGTANSDSGSTVANGHEGTNSNATPALARLESNQVFWSRAVFLGVLFVAAGATAGAVYKVSHDNDLTRFEVRYRDFARQIMEVSEINANSIAAVIDGMSQHITTNTQGSLEKEWPLVTVPQFEAQAQTVMKAAGMSDFGFAPIVTDDTKDAYELYHQQNQGWIQESLEFAGFNHTCEPIPAIWFPTEDGIAFSENEGTYVPAAQLSPILHCSFTNYNLMGESFFRRVFQAAQLTGRSVLSEVRNLGDAFEHERDLPHSFMASPVFDKVAGDDRKIVAVLTGQLPWHSFFRNLVPEGIDGILMVVRNTCDQNFTFLIRGPDVEYLGPSDRHETAFAGFEVSNDFTAFRTPDECKFSFSLYPTEDFRDAYRTNDPWINTVVVIVVFFFTAIFFVIYDQLVERRQVKVMDSATRSHAVVSSLFPENVRDRILEGNNTPKNRKSGAWRVGDTLRTNPLDSPSSSSFKGHHQGRPIADFFASTSIIFADLVGFTAWSSTRDPVEVFTLLEELYGAFDKLATRFGIFKVETIGDCYVAACGLPEIRDDHAVAMFRFSRQCLTKMNDLVHQLAVSLGPGTESLSMRVGIHSGPVTAGVLRGTKSRFQLFGDTVNTAARIESSGSPNQIHMSEQTFLELKRHGKSQWCRPREDAVIAKGKGALKTYWGVYKTTASTTSGPSLLPNSNELASNGISGDPTTNLTVGTDPSEVDEQAQTQEQLIQWNIENLQQILRKIVATREGGSRTMAGVAVKDLEIQTEPGSIVIDEVQDSLCFSARSATALRRDPNQVLLSPKVSKQLEDYVRTISTMYNNNSFHSFAHASHVVQSVRKLFSRMSHTVQTEGEGSSSKASTSTSTMHLDPIVEFAAVFSALIHDVDHQGLPNTVLAETHQELAQMYQNKSVAECNSVDIAWDLLFDAKYSDLRTCIYSTQEELQWFRNLVVNAVLATDVMDKNLKDRRSKCWERAFSERKTSSVAVADLRGTVVLESLLQASDISHTMQHWHVFVKWNQRLFSEMFKAYEDGHTQVAPNEFWYQGELDFFDYYVIPLARQLKESGVFGASSSEYLNYALMNREEWAQKGKQIVEDYLQ